MKSILEYINEAKVQTKSLKWMKQDWDVIQKIVDFVNANPKHAEWYKKMADSKDLAKDYKYDVFGKMSPLLNNLDTWNHIQKNGGKKLGYWTPDGCSEFSMSMLQSIKYMLTAEISFWESDKTKAKYTEGDINLMQSMIESIDTQLPHGEMLSSREDVLKIVEPIVAKYKGAKIHPAEKGWDSVWIECDDFVKLCKELEDAFDDYQNIVVGDGQFDSIYIDYE